MRPSARNTARSAWDGGDRVVGDHDDGLPELVHAATQQGEHVGGGAGVEVAGGFVGEDHCWAAGEGSGAGHPLLLAAGQLAGAVSEAGAQVDGVDDLVQPGRVGGAAGDVGGQGDVLQGGQRGQQVERLEDEPDPVPPQPGERLVRQRRDARCRR